VLTELRSLAAAYAPGAPDASSIRSVAVVGNAPLAQDPARAAAVDACDLVVRVNGFALDGPGRAPTCGKRADVVVLTRGVRATPWLFEDYSRRLYLLNEPGRLHWEPEVLPGWWPADLGLVHVPNREVTLPLAQALALPVTDEPRWATTGTTAAWLAACLFPSASLLLAGFSMIDAPQQTSWEHAVGEACAISQEHHLSAESALLSDWIARGRATLLR
jgi:hypothetical protein